ncbi:MAG: PQQ-binding-like beta-propeller repeat protein [Candidatus Kapabacteria bacterium]|nr:PQQ-binding-like beta-propeller repeat protein [Ignavibacteriota bacterium]MCW5885120.1 PQQ-binding-like beta-propeller repeat protein [Candidatus Kapabacteria bacterium]
MKYLPHILLMLFSITNLNAADVKWIFETDDSCFGMSAMEYISGENAYYISFGCYRNDGNIYVVNSKTGELVWKFFTGESAEGCNDTAPLIYDVDDDGYPELIVASSCTPKTYCFDLQNGTIKWITNTRGSDSPPVIADLDGDGKLEILHGQFGGFVVAIDALTGEKLWDKEVDPNSWIQTAPTIIDIDGDGLSDFVVANWSFEEKHRVFAYRGFDQKLLWTRELNGVVYHGFGITDLDKDGMDDIIFGDYGGTLWALNSKDGSIKWTYQSPLYIGSPVSIGDIDGDDNCELVFTSHNRVIALNHDGSEKWNYVIPDYAHSFRGVALSDMTGNNLKDIVFSSSKGLLSAVEGTSGNLIWDIDLAEYYGRPLDMNHAPVIGDMDGDGLKDVFIVGGTTDYPDFSQNYGAGFCVSTNAPANDEWLMFQNNHLRNGNVSPKEPNAINNQNGNFMIFNNKNLIQIENIDRNLNIKIINLLGQIIYKGIIESSYFEINIENYQNGFYILSIDGYNHKFIKF